MFWVGLKQCHRKTRSLATEHEIIVRSEFGLGVPTWSSLFNEPESAASREVILELVPSGPSSPGDEFPIIHASPSKSFVIDLKPQRLDEMEGGTGGRAQTGDVARIGGDFGFDEDDIHGTQCSREWTVHDLRRREQSGIARLDA